MRTEEGTLAYYAIRYFNIFLSKVDHRIDLRKFNDKMKKFDIPFRVAPISHWYVETVLQLEGLFGKENAIWYPWGRFLKRYKKGVYNPRRWGGWFWIFEWGSRG